jgi:pimeloyl-ACP methyl ester carboxylesterase
VGDEDPGAIGSGLFMKQVSPAVRLSIVPATGHLVNLEKPDLLHRLAGDFLRWWNRKSAARGASER